MYQLEMNEPRLFDGATTVTSEDFDALVLSPSNNQIQKTGAGVVSRDNESLSTSDLERSRDAPPAHHPAASRSVEAAIFLLLAVMPILRFFQLHSRSNPAAFR